QVGSLIVGRSKERMTQLHRTAAMSEWFGVEVQIISPEAAREKWPLLRIDDVLGAGWLPHDGKVIPKELSLALAKGAQSRGATILENVRVLDVLHRDGRATGVRVQRRSGIPPDPEATMRPDAPTSSDEKKNDRSQSGQAGRLPYVDIKAE